jgi:hypothetical protein
VKHLIIAAVLVASTGSAFAQIKDDGYCDYVEGVANANAAVQFSPELIGAVGYLEQPITSTMTDFVEKGARVTAGMRWKISGIAEGIAMRGRGNADCKRHRAFDQVRGETASRAIAARIAVLDTALVEAERILKSDEADFAARRTTAQEATATRVRVEELRTLAAEDKRALATLPEPTGKPLAGALNAYRAADADMERYEAKLRRAQAVDISVRAGIDEFLNKETSSPFFAVIQINVNLGILFQGSANDRAAAGRKRMVESGRGLGVEGTVDQLRATIDIESKRAQETKALVTELERQLEALNKIGGDESKRYRQTVWFEWVKAKAQLAYLTAHVESIQEVIGADAP